MTAAAALDPALESLLAFWAGAGVDMAVEDEPTDKLRRLDPPPRPAQTAAPAALAPGVRSDDLASALLEAQALAQATQNLPGLLGAAERFAPAGFTPAGARRGVLARGSAPADVVVVAGAPGAEEEGAGAFADGAGRFLDRMVSAAGLSGSALFVHVSLWRTPGGRDPTPEEAALTRPFVLRAIDLARPKALLVLGDVAARFLLGRSDGVLKLRREALVWTEHEGRAEAPAVVVSFSPEFLLATPAAKKRAWADLLTLAERVDP
jgi:DNA polymerase